MTPSDVLYLIVGSANAIEISLWNEADQPEDLSGATGLEFAIRTEYGADGVDLLRVTSGITISGNVVTVPISQPLANALRPGRFVCGLKMTINSLVLMTDPAAVDVQEATA